MRAIEKKMVKAINKMKNFSNANTVVIIDGGTAKVYLHGNLIYCKDASGARFTLAGWNTVTTRSRLNALGVGVSQKNWTPYYKGIEISSYEWYRI